MKINYLTTEEVLKIHGKIIETTGGYSGILSFGNLDFIIAKSKISKKIERKVATLLYGIINNHPFLDGNKRTGLAAAISFLNLNGLDLIATEENIWEFLHNISRGDAEINEVTKWLKKNLVRKW